MAIADVVVVVGMAIILIDPEMSLLIMIQQALILMLQQMLHLYRCGNISTHLTKIRQLKSMDLPSNFVLNAHVVEVGKWDFIIELILPLSISTVVCLMLKMKEA